MTCSLENKALYKIGNHTLLIKGGASVRYVRQIFGFEVFSCDVMNSQHPWIINLDRDIDFTIEKPIYAVSSEGYDSFFEMRNGIPSFEMRNKGKKLHFCMEYHDNEVFAASSNDEETLRFALWFAFNLLGNRFGIFGVHSSCIVYDNAAVMFLGESGTGKSTHTRLWYSNFDGSTLLNDDSPIVSTETETAMVFGSPWSGKTACFCPESYPLKAIVRLRQAPVNQMRKLNVIESLAALYPSFPPAFAKVPTLNEKVMTSVSTIITKVPVYQLDCLPDIDAALLSRKTIFGR